MSRGSEGLSGGPQQSGRAGEMRTSRTAPGWRCSSHGSAGCLAAVPSAAGTPAQPARQLMGHCYKLPLDARCILSPMKGRLSSPACKCTAQVRNVRGVTGAGKGWLVTKATLLKKSKRVASSLRPYTESTAKKPLAGSMKKQRRLCSARMHTQPMHIGRIPRLQPSAWQRLLTAGSEILRMARTSASGCALRNSEQQRTGRGRPLRRRWRPRCGCRPSRTPPPGASRPAGATAGRSRTCAQPHHLRRSRGFRRSRSAAMQGYYRELHVWMTDGQHPLSTLKPGGEPWQTEAA